MTLETLQEICKKCGSTLVERTDEDFLSYNLDGYLIDQTDEPILIRGLIECPHPKDKKWQIGKVVLDYGDRYTPESWDVVEVEKVDSLEIAVQKVLSLIALANIEGHFVNAWEDEQAQLMKAFTELAGNPLNYR